VKRNLLGDPMIMTHGSLFDGAGGMRIGLEQSGFRTLWAVDILYGKDVTKINAADLPKVDLISGGPPCQRGSTLSALHHNRTKITLWPDMLRIVSALLPKWVCVENVLGFMPEMASVWAKELQQLGYGCAGQCISSRHWLPQIRTRAFIVARLGITGVALWNYLYRDVQRGKMGAKRSTKKEQSSVYSGPCSKCLRGGIFAGVSSRKFAFVGAGNAVTIPVARYIGERIIETEKMITSGEFSDRAFQPKRLV
jgi:site-specific DNA-cytosine methylase